MKKYVLKFLILFLSFVPSVTFSANIYFETSKENISVGDVFIITVKIDSDKTDINSVDGKLMIESNDDNLIINDFNLANSIFSLWLKAPSLSTDGDSISFVGGIPGGFNLNDATLFNIIAEAKKEGEVKITPKDMAIYANDGKGTTVPISIRGLTIKVFPLNNSITPTNDWQNIVTTDKINPENFIIEIGKDSSIFDGKRFAFFTAIDNQSGISYYEVSENDNTPTRSEGMYVLENQDNNVVPNLKVIAYDKAGNKTISVYKQEPSAGGFSFSKNYIIILVAVIIVWIIFIRIKKIRKNKNNNKNV